VNGNATRVGYLVKFCGK